MYKTALKKTIQLPLHLLKMISNVIHKKIIINIEFGGNLGNRLNTFANLVSFAKENNCLVINLPFVYHAKSFKNFSDSFFCCFPKIDLKFFNRLTFSKRIISLFVNFAKFITKIGVGVIVENPAPYEKKNIEKFRQFFEHKLIVTKGYGFFDKNFNKNSDFIRSIFALTDKCQKHASRIVSPLRELNDVVIGIHIRHGDYKYYWNGKYYYELGDYVEIMRRVLKLFDRKKVGFFISSDQKQDLRNFSEFNFIFSSNKDFAIDMYAFAKCDYIIGPKSSYSRWASFFGKVPCYQISKIDKVFSLEDFVIRGLYVHY